MASQSEAPGSASGSAERAEAVKHVQQLMTEKDDLERQLNVQRSKLGKFGPQGPLVDDEGFPFPDADQWQIKLDRRKFNELNNDHTALMLRIEAGLAAAHAASTSRSVPTAAPSMGPPPQPNKVVPARSTPPSPAPGGLDLLVTQVMEDGPAQAAGVQVDDVITAVNGTRMLSLGDFTTIVRTSVESAAAIQLAVQREGAAADLALQLTPSSWSGPGVLGMRVRQAE